MFLAAAIAMLSSAPTPTLVRHLNTPHYRVTVREFCPQDFDCSHVEYKAVGPSGQTITLHGSHIWHMCPGTNDPCHPIGYQFRNKGVLYFVSEAGELTVSRGATLLLDEQGKWTDE